ncbi:MAG TPA: Mpv17/PMP22 family protein [Bacteroidales bacterium]|nr:Mpv17/PMP22 family protein [Bacteroidales bacterium]
MKRDFYLLLGVSLFFAPFFIFPRVFELYLQLTARHAILMSFIKFAMLATLGEVIGFRIKTGGYALKGFGIFPRAVVWGFLGITIKIAFDIFSAGTPVFLEKTGFEGATGLLGQEMSFRKVLVSFSISTALNLFYAPVLMTFHKITDLHIMHHGGKAGALVHPIRFGDRFSEINWKVQWVFVFKKTIPLFWIPAQTITFLLPEEFRVLFAAFLGIILGVILAIAALKN